MIRALIHCFLPTPMDRADCAIRRAANMTAECERERIKANFYTCMLLDIDPQTEWNLFASIKQKEHDANFAHIKLQERANKANIRAEALIEALKEKPNESTDVDLPYVDPITDVRANFGMSYRRGAGEKRDAPSAKRTAD